MPPRDRVTYHEPPGRPSQSATAPKGIESITEYKPNPRQSLFHTSAADVVGYGGAAGGGKSMAMLAEAFETCRETPGCQVMMMRRTFPELERSLILKSFELFPRDVCRYNEIKHRWIIKPRTGKKDSILEFGFCKQEKDVFQYQSAEWLKLFLDEATHFTWTQVSYLITRVRTVIPGAWPRTYMATNPGNVGHWWFKKYFGIKQKDETWVPEQVFTPPAEPGFDEAPMSRCFIPAKIWDNRALVENDPDYVKRLMLLPANLKAQLLEGSWDSFEGKFFYELGLSHFITKARFNGEEYDAAHLPKYWKFYRCVDYGFSKPFACEWLAAAPDGHFYAFRERYAAKLRDTQQATTIRDATTENIEYTIGDSSMYNKGSAGVSIAENYLTAAGIALVPGTKDNEAAWMAVRNYLAPHPDGTPILQIFENECPNLKRELDDAIADDQNPDVVNTNISDHAIDALKYFCASRPLLPNEEKKDPHSHLDDMSRREWISVLKKQNADALGKEKAILHDINVEEEESFWRD